MTKKDSSLEASSAAIGRAEGRYADPYIAGMALGIVLFLASMLTGHGVGESGGLARLIVAVQGLLAPQSVADNPYAAHITTSGGVLADWVVWVALGTAFGGMVSGLLARRFKLETRRGPRLSPQVRYLFAVLGGALVGFGAGIGRGCTSGQALGGGAMLAVGSWVFMFAVFGGGYAIAYFVRPLWR